MRDKPNTSDKRVELEWSMESDKNNENGSIAINECNNDYDDDNEEAVAANAGEEHCSNSKWFHFKTQILCANIIGISMIHAGLTITFSNMLNSHFSDRTISTFASLSALTTPLGCCLISLTTDRLGRKRNLLMIQICCVITWTTVSVISGNETLYLSAVLTGLSRGALTASCPAYISEITYSRYRQLFLSLTTTFFTLGVFIVSFLNAYTTYVYAALFLSGCFVSLAIATFLFVPESPYWLAVFKSDSIAAKCNLKTLNPKRSVYDKEWRSINEKMTAATAATAPTGVLYIRGKMALVRKAAVYKPCLTLLTLIFFQQFCCIYPFTSYTVRCLPKLAATLAPLYEKQIFLASGAARLVVSVATSVALTTFNQKQLLLVSAAGVCCSNILLLVARSPFASADSHSQDTLVEWISLAGFVVYLLSGFVGLLGVPWTVVFELLPTEAKGFLGPALVAVGYATMSMVLTLFPFIYDHYTDYVFAFAALVSLCAVFYVKRFLVETKGKSLYEIENLYAKAPNEP